MTSLIKKYMGPTWGPPGSCRPQMGPMLSPWTLLFGMETLSTLLSLCEGNLLVTSGFHIKGQQCGASVYPCQRQQAIEQTIELPRIWDIIMHVWHHYNGYMNNLNWIHLSLSPIAAIHCGLFMIAMVLVCIFHLIGAIFQHQKWFMYNQQQYEAQLIKTLLH